MQGQKSLLGFGLCQHISPGVRATTLCFPNCRLAACVSTACCPAKPHTHTQILLRFVCTVSCTDDAHMLGSLFVFFSLFHTHTQGIHSPAAWNTHQVRTWCPWEAFVRTICAWVDIFSTTSQHLKIRGNGKTLLLYKRQNNMRR